MLSRLLDVLLFEVVSILVVVDVGCDDYKLKAVIPDAPGFNPCCGGCRM